MERPKEDSTMRSTRSVISRSVIVGLAIASLGLAGCAQFQDSFGEITGADGPQSEYASANSSTDEHADQPDNDKQRSQVSDPLGQRSFTYGDIQIGMIHGELAE